MSDVENLQKECFLRLRSYGNSLSTMGSPMTREKSKSVSTLLKDLVVELENIPDPKVILSMPNIQVILVPLISTFKSMTIEEKYGYDIVLEPWLKIMHFILSKTLAKFWLPPSFTTELIILFTNCIDRFNKPDSKRESSEEIKHLAVLCLSAAYPAKYKEGRYTTFKESIYYDLTQQIRTEKFILIASTCITALLSLIKKEHNIQLRLDSIELLSQILLDNIYEIDSVARLLPGVVSKLCAIIAQRAEKENHEVLCSSLYVLGDVIKAVMSDKFNDTLVEINSFQDILASRQKPDSNEDKPSVGNKQLRTKEWYSKSKENIASMTSQILKIRLYPDWRSRLAFVDFAYTLLSTCARTLDNCIKPLVETLVLHTDDPYDEVSNACRYKMDSLLSTSAFEDSVKPILKDELYHWIVNFPTYMMVKDETEKCNAMSMIAGFTILLGDDSESVLSNVLSRASDSWIKALEIDRDSLNILEEKESERFIELQADDVKSTPTYPRIRFKHVVTDLTAAKLIRVLNVIGKYCDLQLWIDNFMRYISVDNNDFNEPQAAYIIYALLAGAATKEDETTTNVQEWINYEDDVEVEEDSERLKIITLQTMKDIMDILTAAASHKANSIALISKSSTFRKLDEESGHVLTVCFGLQIVGLAASILSQDCLQDQLITILYPLLAHLGSSNVYVHTYALVTLDTIALTCGLENAQELAMRNVDYIINMISQHITLLNENPRVPLVLKALIHVGGYPSISHLDDTILEIYDALDRYNSIDWMCIQLCGVLFEVVQTIERNSEITASISSPKDENNSITNAVEVSPEIRLFIDNKEDVYGEERESHKSMEEIGEYFLNRQKEGKHDDLTLEQAIMEQNLPMDLPKDNDDDENAEKAVKEQEEEIPLSKEEKMTVEIMDKACLFLTSSSPQLRSQMLILLTSGATILSGNPQELNKVIFNMWPYVVNRFDDTQNYVVFQAANFVQKLSEISTDFLSGKFEKDLWPRFKTLLQRGVEAATKNNIVDYSPYSLYHRTQLCLLKTLTQICKYVPMKQRKIKEILEGTKYYYHNDRVHDQLTKQCKLLFASLSTQQPDTVWFYQIALEGQAEHPELSSPPSPILNPFLIPSWIAMPHQVLGPHKSISMA